MTKKTELQDNKKIDNKVMKELNKDNKVNKDHLEDKDKIEEIDKTEVTDKIEEIKNKELQEKIDNKEEIIKTTRITKMLPREMLEKEETEKDNSDLSILVDRIFLYLCLF